MKDQTQLSLFGQDCLSADADEKGSVWKLFIDGASRNNPGKAGAGIYLLHNGTLQEKKGFFLGIRTNNQAEYLALILGIFYFKKHAKPGEPIRIVSDSQLLVRQMIGEYRVKDPDLRRLQNMAFILLKGYSYRFCHVMREYNKEADACANKGIDEEIGLPDDFIQLLKIHEIPI